ncbi:MAG: non-canonical purine NTP pyrophosphatase, partial [Ginsengibacter sp.]
MISLIFATNNANKVREVNSLLGGKFELQTLLEAGINIDIPEPYYTL